MQYDTYGNYKFISLLIHNYVHFKNHENILLLWRIQILNTIYSEHEFIKVAISNVLIK